MMKKNRYGRSAFSRYLKTLFVFSIILLGGCFTTTIHHGGYAGIRLSPLSFGQEVSLFQRITVHENERVNQIEIALEIDADRIDLVGLAMGQRVLSLHYDGTTLTSSRHTMLPKEVQAEDVLENLQMALWPEDAVRDALPSGWKMEESAGKRFFYLHEQLVSEISYSTEVRWLGVIEIHNQRFGYHLVIHSVSAV